MIYIQFDNKFDWLGLASGLVHPFEIYVVRY